MFFVVNVKSFVMTSSKRNNVIMFPEKDKVALIQPSSDNILYKVLFSFEVGFLIAEVNNEDSRITDIETVFFPSIEVMGDTLNEHATNFSSLNKKGNDESVTEWPLETDHSKFG